MTPAQAAGSGLSRSGSPAAGSTAGPPLGPADAASPGEAAALLILVRSGRLAPARYSELVETAGSALAVLTRERLTAALQTSLVADPEQELEAELHTAAREIAGWRAQGMRLITVLDRAAYPANLAAAHDRPPLIFVAGRWKPRDERGVAVIGSREPTRLGLRTAQAMAEHLVQAGYTVLSGLASGIDTAAHTAALKRGGRTVAVIGTGLSRCYPRANVILQRRIAAECAVVSQFLPDTPPTKQTFPMRNAVMSGLSLATVIIEASATSGTRIQARHAIAQGRPLFLLQSLLDHRWARELAELPGVHVVEEPSEVTAALDRLTSTASLVA